MKPMPDHPAQKSRAGEDGLSTRTKILAIGLVFIIVVIAATILTTRVTNTTADAGTNLPFGTQYRVTLPDGEPVTIGNSRIVVMSYENEMVTDVDGNREKLVIGEERVISPRHAQITVFGIPVFNTDFQITLHYLGTNDKNANFDMTVKTSKQVPDFLLRLLIPSNMNAQPE
jgi:hypothetical protein